MVTMPREDLGARKNKNIRLPKKKRIKQRMPLFCYLSTVCRKTSIKRMPKQLTSKPSNKSTSIRIQDWVLLICQRIQSLRANISSMRWKMISMVGDGNVLLLVINVSIDINFPKDTS